MNGLDPFSRSFAAALFKSVPDLMHHAFEDEGSLRIELSPGPSRPDCEFWVSTAEDEITVGFGIFHQHFRWPVSEPYFPENDPIVLIKAVIADEMLVEDSTLDGKWAGSKLLHADEKLDTSDLRPGNVVYVRSWSGKRDREIRG